MQKQWNVQALEADLPRLLAMCRTPTERATATVLHGIEVRELAAALAAQGRLTPGARAIAEKYGFRHGGTQ